MILKKSTNDNDLLAASHELDKLNAYELSAFEQAEVFRLRGQIMRDWGGFNESLGYLEKALEGFKKSGSVRGEIQTVYSMMGLFSQNSR